MGLGSGIRKKPIPEPGSRGKKGTGSRIRNTAFILANLQICGLGHKENVRTCGLIITNLRIGTPQKFAHLKLRNEPKNADLRFEV
jgi:hypothetical protein